MAGYGSRSGRVFSHPRTSSVLFQPAVAEPDHLRVPYADVLYGIRVPVPTGECSVADISLEKNQSAAYTCFPFNSGYACLTNRSAALSRRSNIYPPE